MRLFDAGAREGPEVVSNRILTVPNALSLARLAILPVVYLDLASGEADRLLRSLVLTAVFAATDWFDGYIARRFDQVSRFGKLLDPISDRLLLLTVAVGMVVAGILPLWAVLVLAVRELVVLAGGLYLLSKSISPPAVTRLGKAATFGLMVALPLFVLAAVVGGGADRPDGAIRTAAWVLYGLNLALYYVAMVDYVRTVRRDLRAVEPIDRRAR